MESKSRKMIRLREYDYSSDEVYFLTLCSKNRKPIFSSFFDHIIRNGRDYSEHCTYIEKSPIKWELDELYTKKKHGCQDSRVSFLSENSTITSAYDGLISFITPDFVSHKSSISE